MAGVRGRWYGRPNLSQIETKAFNLVGEFRRKLQEVGLTVPPIPPVPVEYLVLIVTDLSLRGVSGLSHEGKKLAGLLDPSREEICYEENDPPGRQSFSIAHELGHYFLHFLPMLEEANLPTLFSDISFESDVKPERAVLVSDGLSREASATQEQNGAAQVRDNIELQPRYYRCSESEIGLLEETRPGKLSKAALTDPLEQARLVRIIRQKERADRFEWEANIFARGLLMPSDLVRWLNTKHEGEVAGMAEELGVTQTALRYRLNGLGLRHDENMGMPLKSKSKILRPDQSSFL